MKNKDGIITLDRLYPMDPRKVWTTEDGDFTPWLAREENLQLLGETLGMSLELDSTESRVGPFRADLLCRDIGEDSWVLVENQLASTDHKHLGQLFTYASGLQAVTLIWIATNFVEEHRSALDWLNSITNENFRFFGVELQLWSIGNSPPAPHFNIVSKPNQWSKQISQAAQGSHHSNLSETKLLQLKYWETFQSLLEEKNGVVRGNNQPHPKPWISYPIGKTGMHLSAVMLRLQKKVRAELYLKPPHSSKFFWQLKNQKEEIVNELGFELVWEELPQKASNRIAVYLDPADPEDEADWGRQHEWLAEKLNNLHCVLRPRVQLLEPDESEDDEE